MNRILIFVAAGVLVLAGAGSLSAQVVRGRLVEAGTEKPIVGGSVILLTEAGDPVIGKLSDATGGFEIDARRPGRYKLSAEFIGYQNATGGPVELAAGDTVTVELRMSTTAIALDPLIVVTEARVRHLEQSGFYSRQKMGFGRFITRDEIDQWQPTRLSDVLRTTPGVRLVPRGGLGGAEPVLRNAASLGSGQCLPAVYVDGMRVREPGVADPPFDDLVQPFDIEAVEVYRGASEVPAQFGGSQSACGVIVVWTRR